MKLKRKFFPYLFGHTSTIKEWQKMFDLNRTKYIPIPFVKFRNETKNVEIFVQTVKKTGQKVFLSNTWESMF